MSLATLFNCRRLALPAERLGRGPVLLEYAATYLPEGPVDVIDVEVEGVLGALEGQRRLVVRQRRRLRGVECPQPHPHAAPGTIAYLRRVLPPRPPTYRDDKVLKKRVTQSGGRLVFFPSRRSSEARLGWRTIDRRRRSLLLEQATLWRRGGVAGEVKRWGRFD
ncbi:unnamed protein product [Linum trigynum]|uniref:Uncharacterized protein n=1 Tax=Linum trigynum TaxID=586398 RepID=A0AAV2FSD0_9ROSI